MILLALPGDNYSRPMELTLQQGLMLPTLYSLLLWPSHWK